MVSSPTLTAVSASISTPVRPRVSTVTTSRIAFRRRSTANSAATRVRLSGWHKGMRSLVRLAPWIAARRAAPSTSSFLAPPATISLSVAAFMLIVPSARATRFVSGFSPTPTIWAWPEESKWLSFPEDFIQGRIVVRRDRRRSGRRPCREGRRRGEVNKRRDHESHGEAPVHRDEDGQGRPHHRQRAVHAPCPGDDLGAGPADQAHAPGQPESEKHPEGNED